MYADGAYSDLTYSGNSGTAAGTALQIDAWVNAERLANPLISQLMGSERLANFLIGLSVPMEWIGKVLSIQQDAVLPLAWSAAASVTAGASLESSAAFLIGASTSLESLQGVQINQPLPQEQSSAVREDSVLYALSTAVVVTTLDQVFQEWLANPVNDWQFAVERSSLWRTDQIVPLEYNMFQTIQMSVLTSLEWLKSSSIASPIDAEWLSVFLADGMTPIEWRPRFTYSVVTEGVRVVATIRGVQVEPIVRNVRSSITKRGAKVV